MLLEKIIIFIEKYIPLYLPKLYKLGILLSYYKGFYDRKTLNKNKNKKNLWYE